MNDTTRNCCFASTSRVKNPNPGGPLASVIWGRGTRCGPLLGATIPDFTVDYNGKLKTSGRGEVRNAVGSWMLHEGLRFWLSAGFGILGFTFLDLTEPIV
jgi:hypothetical protein